MADRRLTREWIHSIIALILGLFLLGMAPNAAFLKGVVDLVGTCLAVPEYPAVLLRDFLRNLILWSQDKSDLKNQVEALKEEIAQMRITHSTILAEQIRAELNARMDRARVSLREPQGWWNEFRIDKGFNDGIVVGLPVFQDGYLAGRVTSVSTFSSWVELLTSPSLMIPVVIEETRELGVVVGDGEGSVLLTYIPEGRGIEPGMSVSTALVSEMLPSGIPVGKIVEEVRDPSGNASGYVTYKIEPGAKISMLYIVSVLKYSESSWR